MNTANNNFELSELTKIINQSLKLEMDETIINRSYIRKGQHLRKKCGQIKVFIIRNLYFMSFTLMDADCRK